MSRGQHGITWAATMALLISGGAILTASEAGYALPAWAQWLGLGAVVIAALIAAVPPLRHAAVRAWRYLRHPANKPTESPRPEGEDNEPGGGLILEGEDPSHEASTPKLRSELPQGGRGSLTVTRAPHQTGVRTTMATFSTDMVPGQKVPLPFRPTGLRLKRPQPIDDRVIRAAGDLWKFENGEIIIHEITDTGFSVEVRPNDLVVEVEIEAYGSPTP